jgi:hypothetical protein
MFYADSVLASWADAIDSNVVDNSADVSAVAVPDSDVSSNSDSSDPDASFFAEADFAVAVQRAAEKSGLMVVGSTVMDPNYGPREKGEYYLFFLFVQTFFLITDQVDVLNL